MFAFVILARRCLRIHHRDHVVTLTIFARKVVGTPAHIIVDAIYASAAILANMILAIVDVLCTVDTMEAGHTLASVVRKVIMTFSAICAWIEFVTAKVDLCVAVLTCWECKKIVCINTISNELPPPSHTCKARLTFTRIRFHAIHTGGIVLTLDFAQAIVNVGFTTRARIAGRTLTAKTPLFQHSAGGVVATWIAIAGVDHELTMFAVIAWLTQALVIALR